MEEKHLFQTRWPGMFVSSRFCGSLAVQMEVRIWDGDTRVVVIAHEGSLALGCSIWFWSPQAPSQDIWDIFAGLTLVLHTQALLWLLPPGSCAAGKGPAAPAAPAVPLFPEQPEHRWPCLSFPC